VNCEWRGESGAREQFTQRLIRGDPFASA